MLQDGSVECLEVARCAPTRTKAGTCDNSNIVGAWQVVIPRFLLRSWGTDRKWQICQVPKHILTLLLTASKNASKKCSKLKLTRFPSANKVPSLSSINQSLRNSRRDIFVFSVNEQKLETLGIRTTDVCLISFNKILVFSIRRNGASCTAHIVTNAYKRNISTDKKVNNACFAGRPKALILSARM